MKTSAAIVAFIALVASASAFTAPFATRAVGKKPVARKAPARKAPARRAPARRRTSGRRTTPPASKGYPVWEGAQNIQFKNISGGGNKAPPVNWVVPDFSDPKLQIRRDPRFYAAAAKNRLAKDKIDYVYDDGLSELERKQRRTIPAFLTGSAKSQADLTTVRNDVSGEDFAFGLNGDRFQLLFISIFGLFTLVGTLSGAVQL